MRSAARSATDCRNAPEVVQLGLQPGHAHVPGRERLPHVLALLAEVPLDCVRLRLLARERGDDVDAQSSASRGEVEVEADARPSIVPRREKSTCVLAPPSRLSSSTSWFAAPAVAHRRPAAAAAGRAGVAEGEVVLLDRDDVREVGTDLELELECQRREALVPEHEHVLHPVAHEPLARDRERVLHEPVRDGVACR